MLIINYPQSYKALNTYVDVYNSLQEKSADKIKGSTLSTAKEIIRIYGASLVKINAIQKLIKESGIKSLNEDNLPSLATNNAQLAKLVKVSTKTIYRHIKKLQKAKIITEKVWHGSNANYELWINGEILCIGRKSDPNRVENHLKTLLETAKQNEVELHLLESQKTKCPHTYSSNTRNYKNNILIDVDKVDNSLQSNLETSQDTTGNEKKIRGSLRRTAVNFTGNKKTGYTGEIEQKSFPVGKEAGEIELRAKRSSKENPKLDQARLNSLNFYVELLWMLARNLLYDGVSLTEKQAEIGKKWLQKYYAPVETSKLGKVHKVYAERIALASKYIKKRPDKRYAQLPYLYFDLNNPNGFIGTKKWYEEHCKRKEEVRLELVLDQQIKKYLNNLNKTSEQQQSQLVLFRQCEARLGKLGDPTLLNKFHAAVLDPEGYQKVYSH